MAAEKPVDLIKRHRKRADEFYDLYGRNYVPTRNDYLELLAAAERVVKTKARRWFGLVAESPDEEEPKLP